MASLRLAVRGHDVIDLYATTKHALKAIADSLREEVNTDGLRVLSLFLGRTSIPVSVYSLNERHDARATDVRVLRAEMRYTFESDILAEKEDRMFKLRTQCNRGNCTEDEIYQLQRLESEVTKLRNSVDGWEKEWKQQQK